MTALAQLFGVLALVLASIGLYGVTAHAVSRRTNEIGVRTALGATRAAVVRLVLAGALTQAAIGLVAGIPAAYLAAQLLSNQLYRIESTDPKTWIAAAIVLTLCAAVASVIPALRASAVDPVVALRSE